MSWPRDARPRVVIVGGGAAGTLTAIHLLRLARRRETGLDVTILEPGDRCSRGVAFGTRDDGHLLNVPACGMSALADEPSHFVAWRQRNFPDDAGGPATFAPRRQFGLYLEDVLAEAIADAAGDAAVHHRRECAVGVRRTATGVSVTTANGHQVGADALVVATGLPEAGTAWAPEDLRSSPFFVPDPWAPGALEVVKRDRNGRPDVLVVGTGLTAVDVLLSLSDPTNRPDRRLVAVSRSGAWPRVHRAEPKLVAIPDVSDWPSDLAGIREEVEQHIAGVRAATGDWRPALDGLRFTVSTLWARLSEADRTTFLAEDAAAWNRHRHRMPPSSAVVLRELQATGRLTVQAGEVASAADLSDGGVQVTLTDGTKHEVGWVVNATGPQTDVRCLGNPFLDDLLRPRAAAALGVAATAGLGVRTRAGRLVDSTGSTGAPIWTLGALRRGELWESTAVPELRAQAAGLATAVLDDISSRRHRSAATALIRTAAG